MAFTVTPNMSLRAIVEKDRTWYFDWVHNFNKLDGHRHITGEGRQIPTAGIADQAITAGKIANNSITDTQISATAAIQGTKITPNFGAQDIATTGIITFDGTNGFRYNTGLLEYREGGGSWAQFSALAGANAQLSNLSSVAINQSLDFDTDDTYDIGTAIKRVKEAFIGILNTAEVKVYDSTFSNKFVKLISKSGLVSDIQLQLPSTLPSETSILTISSSGEIEAGDSVDSLLPIGSIIPFYDFDANLTFNTNKWAYCNGQTKNILGTPRVLPDTSRRYLVGFGTDGGADIGTAIWDVSVVGNANHEVTLTADQSGLVEHNHTASAGNQSANHTHSIPSWCNSGGGGAANRAYAPAGSSSSSFASGNNSANHTHTITVNPKAAASAVSAHSIQPSSIRVRFIMRIA